MKTREDIESYLLKLGQPAEQLRPDVWNIQMDHHENLLVSIAGPVVVFRMKVMELPSSRREELFEALLRLNTTDLVHAAFGIEGNAIVITHAFELESLDFNEFQAVVDEVSMAVAKHYPALSKFRAQAA